ncbi:MAG: hypothetical protein ACM3SX_20000 [Deltaproteobacteria bacterium]
MVLKPGNLTASSDINDPAFLNSMASEIESELSALMTNDGLPPLSMDLADRSVRDRRRLFVAIARGVVRHLAENPDAFVLTTNTTGVSAALDHIETS